MGRRKPRSLSAAIGQVRGSLTPPTVLAAVQAEWEEIAGTPVAAVTKPAAERAGVLTVHCADPVWAEELTLMSATLLERIRERMGPRAPHELRFKAGDIAT